MTNWTTLPFENLRAYQAARTLVVLVREAHISIPHLHDQAMRAATRTCLNIAEATGRAGLQRVGVTADTVKPGDTIKARCHHLRDGSNGCGCRRVFASTWASRRVTRWAPHTTRCSRS